MRIVLGVLEPDGGEVRWKGRRLDAAARARFGYMPEERGLYPKMRVADQLVHLARLHGVPTARARQAAGEWLERLGLTEVAGRRTETLSLGNQQRAQLGAALVHDPELLVLDEPFSGLDPVGVDVLSEVLRDRARAGVPVVFSSHQLELVERLCDAVAIVRGGRVVASGRVAELRAARGGRRWRVDLVGAPDDWVADVAAASVVARDNGAVVVELTDAGDEQALLDAARRAGRVRRFAPEEPTLAELFREVVA
jgi:ABC-2 type transport system ATP-binding protein